jgi:hypothetical protein
MKNLHPVLTVIMGGLFIFCSCNKEKKNPLFGDYNTVYIHVNFPANDSSIIYDQIISVSYFTDDQIKAGDWYLYKSNGLENYYTGGDMYVNTSWSLQYFPQTDSIEFRWNQYDATSSSETKLWKGIKIK